MYSRSWSEILRLESSFIGDGSFEVAFSLVWFFSELRIWILKHSLHYYPNNQYHSTYFRLYIWLNQPRKCYRCAPFYVLISLIVDAYLAHNKYNNSYGFSGFLGQKIKFGSIFFFAKFVVNFGYFTSHLILFLFFDKFYRLIDIGIGRNTFNARK